MTAPERPSRLSIPLALALAAAVGIGCSGHSPASAQGQKEGAPRSGARTLEIPGTQRSRPQPQQPQAQSTLLEWDAPDGWEAERPRSTMRYAQYRIPGGNGEAAECVVYYFGPGQGGDPMSNARRWAGQFTQPGGGSSLDVMKVERLESGGVPAQVIEVTGTYDGGMTMTDAPAQSKAGYMLLGGIAEGPDAPWFFKFTGPEATVRAQREAFIEMLRSLRKAG